MSVRAPSIRGAPFVGSTPCCCVTQGRAGGRGVCIETTLVRAEGWISKFTRRTSFKRVSNFLVVTWSAITRCSSITDHGKAWKVCQVRVDGVGTDIHDCRHGEVNGLLDHAPLKGFVPTADCHVGALTSSSRIHAIRFVCNHLRSPCTLAVTVHCPHISSARAIWSIVGSLQGCCVYLCLCSCGCCCTVCGRRMIAVRLHAPHECPVASMICVSVR